LGDESRRRILAAISRKGNCSAGELVELFDFAQPTVSKHLRVLETAGLLSRHVDGRRHFFTLGVAPLKEADSWLRRHLSFWENSLDQLADFLESSETKRGGA
jgi:DNA-binding transcriptional ArsR family regulator